jgi:hypothetical protein
MLSMDSTTLIPCFLTGLLADILNACLHMHGTAINHEAHNHICLFESSAYDLDGLNDSFFDY